VLLLLALQVQLLQLLAHIAKNVRLASISKRNQLILPVQILALASNARLVMLGLQAFGLLKFPQPIPMAPQQHSPQGA